MDIGFCTAREHRVIDSDRRLRTTLVFVGLMLVILSSAFAPLAQANGAPVDIFLDYMPGISVWGPSDATGHAIVAVGEGRVDLETKGLPRLQDQVYQVWLERADTGEAVAVGGFNVENGKGELHVLLNDMPYTAYRLLFVTVESSTGLIAKPSAQRSLGGRFPNTDLAREALVQSSGDSAAGTDGSKAGPRPEFLPVTGEVHIRSMGVRSAISGFLLVALLAAVAWALQRRVSP